MNQEIKKDGNDFEVLQAKGVVTLTETEKDFAAYVGYEVKLLEGGTGINLGLYFPDTWAEDGILKANGVNVFFPEQNKIFVQNFNQVELIFPNGISRMNQTETLYGFMGWLTSREEVITLSSHHMATPAVEAITKFMDVNKLPPVRDGWGKGLVHPEDNPHANDKCSFPPNTKNTSSCLLKAKDDEPIFVLLARDPSAPGIIMKWIEANHRLHPVAKIISAYKVGASMFEWQEKQNK